MPTLAQLDQLAQRIPARNQQAAKRQQQAGLLQARAAVGKAHPSRSTRQVAQTAAPVLAAAQSQAGLQAQAATQQQLAGLGQQRLSAQQFAGEQRLGRQALAQQAELGSAQRQQQRELGQAALGVQRTLTEDELDRQRRLQSFGFTVDNQIFSNQLQQQEDLAAIDQNLKDAIFGARQTFKMDQGRQQLSNEIQLADFAMMTAKNEDEALNKLQSIQHAHDMKINILEQAYKTISQQIESESAIQRNRLDNEQVEQLAQMKAKLKKDLARSKKTAALAAGMLSAAGMIAGTMMGGPVVGAAGAAVGSAAGTGIAQATT